MYMQVNKGFSGERLLRLLLTSVLNAAVQLPRRRLSIQNTIPARAKRPRQKIRATVIKGRT
jgi:hypothetical protein